ncbi:MAG TPA: hypothetical protein VHD60_03715 [Candidatus Saccharimonadales bacterium]|nr:hypothetical protein [Candidatus Saccharimonadales bacterium]
MSPDVKIVPLDTTAHTALLHSTATYQQAASKLFADSFANGNKITVNTEQISKRLQDEFPELSQVSITLPLIGHRPVVYVQMSQPAFILVASQRAYVIGQRGHVLAQADQATVAQADLPVITDHSGIDPATTATPLPSSDVMFITDVLYELKHAGIAVSGLNLPAAASEFDVSIKGQPFFVKFNMQSGTARQQSGTFLALWQYLRQQHITPAHYIDVRVDGRAYYK